jgi:hypothetical protein
MSATQRKRTSQLLLAELFYRGHARVCFSSRNGQMLPRKLSTWVANDIRSATVRPISQTLW